MLKISVAALFCFLSLSVAADTLETKNYIVKVESLCGEGHVTCERVSYYGESKSSGLGLALTGHTKHSMCKDGTTPCRFLGYEFKNGLYTYFVSAAGELVVTKGKTKVLVQESGIWAE